MLIRIPRHMLCPHPPACRCERGYNLLVTGLPGIKAWPKGQIFCSFTLFGFATNWFIIRDRDALPKMNVERRIDSISRFMFSHLLNFCFGQGTGYVWVLITLPRTCWARPSAGTTNTLKRFLPTTLSGLLKEKHTTEGKGMCSLNSEVELSFLLLFSSCLPCDI